MSKTRIFARSLEGNRQLLVYSMSLVADQDLAMVLPIPVPAASPEDAVRFVDLSSSPTFFDQLDALFPAEITRGFGLHDELSLGAPQARQLVVHDVGDFEASFVPTRADFDRLDPRFRLPGKVWDALPSYADWGFCVFKLRSVEPVAPVVVPEAKPSFVARVLDLFGSNEVGAPDPTPPREFHPMAFEFPRKDGRLYFPTTHVHDGEVHPTAHFDHTLYGQHEAGGAFAEWERASLPVSLAVGTARPWLSETDPIHRRKLHGDLPNKDVLVG